MVREPEESDECYSELIKEQVETAIGTSLESLNASSANDFSQYNKQIDLVFAFNVSYPTATFVKTESNYNNFTGTQLEHAKMDINRMMTDLYAAGISANVSFVQFNGNNANFTTHKINGYVGKNSRSGSANAQ